MPPLAGAGAGCVDVDDAAGGGLGGGTAVVVEVLVTDAAAEAVDAGGAGLA